MSATPYTSTYTKINTEWAPLVQQILPEANTGAGNTAQSTAISMKTSIDSLVNQLSSQTAANTNKLIALAKAGLLEAQVVTSKPLIVPANTGTPSQASNQQTQFLLGIKVNNQLIELVSSQALPPNTKLQLVVKPDNSVMIVSIAQQNGKNQVISSQDKSNITLPVNQALIKQPFSNLSSPLNNTPINSASSQSGQLTNSNLVSTPVTIIEQNLRQGLPLQQPIDKLLPLLQQVNKQSLPQWPKPLIDNIKVLLQQFPNAQQLQQPAGLKQAIHNSGVFFEAKLAALISNHANSKTVNQPNSSPINYDIKGLLQRIIGQVDRSTNNNTETQPSQTFQTSAAKAILASLTALRPTDSNQTPVFSYTPQPLSELLPTLQKPAASNTDNGKNADILLRQLGHQLIATLARSQINQLETLMNRRSGAPDAQTQINSWSLETPIIQGDHIDHLKIRIDQKNQEEENTDDKSAQTKQWTAMLAFDLHSLGKMNVQLTIIDKSVSAIVWTEHQHTHLQAQKEAEQLKKNLQKVGVNVKKIDCQLGLPKGNSQPLYNKLVDVRT